jgi:tetratricopeptide (TPR) repeat protein
MRRSAHAEAIGHFRHGLEVVQRLSKTPERTWHELLLYTEIGPALMLAKGQADSEVEQVYTQARPLCEQVGDPHQISLVLAGLWRYYHARGMFEEAQKLGEQLLTFARRHQDDGLLLAANWMLGATLTLLGDGLAARARLEEGITIYDPRQHQDFVLNYGTNPAMGLYAYGSWALWMLGYPDLAMQRRQVALTAAQELSDPSSIVISHNMCATLYLFCREERIVQELAEISIALCNENGLAHYHLAWGTALRGAALLLKHQEEGLEQLQQGLTVYQGTGASLLTPYFLVLLAEAYGNGGKTEEGLIALTEAFLIADKYGSYFLEAELYRLKGTLLLQQSPDNTAEAEPCFHQAITIAQNQSAKSWELRAATSLAQLWQSQGKRQEAYDLLAPVYNWFTEGFDTADLQDAKALLDELA